jgi:hypothetical protein
MSGSAGRAAAGAFSVGSALGAALTDRRILGPAEAGLLFIMAAMSIVVGVLAALWPRALAWPIAFIAMWSGIAWLVKGVSLRRGRPSGPRVEQLEDAMKDSLGGPASPEGEGAPSLEPTESQSDDRKSASVRANDNVTL